MRHNMVLPASWIVCWESGGLGLISRREDMDSREVIRETVANGC